MKLALTFGMVLACVSASASDTKSQGLATATAVRIVDQRIPAFQSTTNGLVPDVRSAGIIVSDTNTIVALARAIENAPGKWKRGSFTTPAGYKRFAFLHDSQVFAVIGLGTQFLVRGSGGDWESKAITKELETKINAFGQQGAPNQHLQATPR